MKSTNAGNSGAEDAFVQLFCDVFGPEKGTVCVFTVPLSGYIWQTQDY